ncbi:helix-turn-helix domain-containing protein [Flammeovirga aprica]|uniref:Helix-turn-helix transcriptional regulator n=1 Tax=Flammeovirga aprica JL-4 TaxID=694437 RepID=A0A7X9S0N5_9BACT|nr:helix-turn-helix domain-containing protein [Flammeovirga aprica]NME71992.1 helix-turn-helix transcriptional regulator [Flammeovirga aprica JL-4]
MNIHFLNGQYTEKALEEYISTFDEFKINRNHYWGKSEDGEFNYWLFDEFGELLSSVMYEIKTSKPVRLFDIYEKEKGFLLSFVIDSNVSYNNKSIGSGFSEGAVLFNSNQKITLDVDENRTYKGITCHLSYELMRKTGRENFDELKDLVVNQNHFALFESMTYEMEQCLRELFALQTEKVGRYGFSSAKILELISHFFVQLYTHRTGHKKFDLTEKETIAIFNIKSKIMEDLMHPPTIEALSIDYGVSIPKLRKDFKNVFGLSPHQFIIRERLYEARRKVIQTKDSMTEIADLLGFTDSSHFTKLYKKEFGVTPLNDRKEHHS